MSQTAKKALGVAAPALAGVGVLVPIFLALGIHPWEALETMLMGALGSGEAWTNTLLKFCPLLLVGMGILIAFRTGFLNIGGEGQFMAGALGAAAWAKFSGSSGLALGSLGVLIAGLTGGAVLSWLAAWMRVRFGVRDVIGTLMLNFVALYLVSYAVHGPLQEAAGAYPQTDVFPEAMRLGRLGGGRLHDGIWIAPLLAALSGFWIMRTTTGFMARAVGSGPRAAEAGGIPASKLILLSAALSGGLCGLAGAVEAAGVSGRVFEGFSAGYGYTAIAVALLARLNVVGVLGSAFFFAVLMAGAGSAQRSLGIPSVTIFVVQGVVIAAVAVSAGKKP